MSGINDFTLIRQGAETNALTKLNYDNAIIGSLGTAKVSNGNLTAEIVDFKGLGGFKTSTHKLLDALISTYTNGGAVRRTVVIPLADYMERCNLKARQKAYNRVSTDLNRISNMKISFTRKNSLKGKNKSTEVSYLDICLCEAKGIYNGNITFEFTERFINILNSYPIMNYPVLLWGINDKRNPNSYYFLKKISEHKNMNMGKSNEDIISVNTLLRSSPYIPTYEEVKSGKRQFKQRIVQPFERDLNALHEILQWEYADNGKPIKENERQSISYFDFERLNICIHWNNYPDTSKRLEDKSRISS